MIGMIDYYRDVLTRGSHTIKPLIILMSVNTNFRLTFVEQEAFE